jgi:hypothetical protein
MKQQKQLRIWHVGNWCVHIGQKYVESPFEAPSKDVEVLNYAQPLIDALRSIPNTEVISQPSWELYHMSPEAFDERLEWATTAIFADVETKCCIPIFSSVRNGAMCRWFSRTASICFATGPRGVDTFT